MAYDSNAPLPVTEEAPRAALLAVEEAISPWRRAIADHVNARPGDLSGLAVDCSVPDHVGFPALLGGVHWRKMGGPGLTGEWRWTTGSRGDNLYIPFPDRDFGDTPLIVTEGETSAITVAANLDVAALATTGPQWPRGESLARYAQGRRVILWMDGDDSGRRWMDSMQLAAAEASIIEGPGNGYDFIPALFAPTVGWGGIPPTGRDFGGEKMDARSVWLWTLLECDYDRREASERVFKDLFFGCERVPPPRIAPRPPQWREAPRSRRRFTRVDRDEVLVSVAARVNISHILQVVGARLPRNFNPDRPSSVHCWHGEDRRPSLRIAPRPGGGHLFFCHACGAEGSTIDLLAMATGTDPKKVFREAAAAMNGGRS